MGGMLWNNNLQVVDYIVSGAGGRHYRDPVERQLVKDSVAQSLFVHQDNGFVWFNAEKNMIQVRFYNASGQVIYRFFKRKEWEIK